MSEPTHDQPPATVDDDLLAALADDFAARLRGGQRATAEEYAAKHPELAERIRKTFPAIAMIEGARSVDSETGGERVGGTIGRYKLLERIGEGGFGVVYMAEQLAPVRRKIALKVIKPGMDSRQVLARFEAERQALAIMDHPNIAKVFDGGMTDAGRPYFVMELVKGEPITSYCDAHQLPPRQRLELFVQVCDAVQHAHQKGIIHRDLKPTNILVAMLDATAVVKVIDFGIAKALGQELTEKTLFTGFAQLVGTPLYVSPEQAGHSSLDVDTRSDIYSLGVLLYELLTGTTPFDKERFRKAAQDEIRRIIREEEPPKPSTRLIESRASLASISAQRHTEPAKLTKLVRGELDWIVMKTLEKDRNRRYETANGLAADVRRYLADDPVHACPPSAPYRLRKFARRNKAAMAVIALLLSFLLLIGSGIGWSMRDRAAREAEVARDRNARQAKVAGQIELILTEVDRLEREQKWPEALAVARRAETAVTGGEADEATARRVRDRLKDLEFIDRLERARMLKTTWVGRTFDYAAADRAYVDAFRDHGVDVDQLAVETSIQRLRTRPQFAIPIAAALDDWIHGRRNTDTGALDWTQLVAVTRGIDPEPVRNRLRATWGRPDSEVSHELRLLAESIDIQAQHPATLVSISATLRRVGHADAAHQLLRDAQRVHPADFWVNFHLGHVLEAKKDYEGAVRFYTAAVAIRPHAVAALNNLGLALLGHGKVDETIGVFRRAVELEPNFARGYFNLGYALSDKGDLDGAVSAYRKATEIEPRYAVAYLNLAVALRKQGKVEEAVAACRRAIELDPRRPAAYRSLGAFLGNDLKDYAGAIECIRKAIELEPGLADNYFSLSNALHAQGDVDQAALAFRDYERLAFLPLRETLRLKPDDAKARDALAWRLNNAAWVWVQRAGHPHREPSDAVKMAKEAVELAPKAGMMWNTLGAAQYRAGDWNAAIAALEKSMELRRQGSDSYDWFFVAMAHWQLGNKDEARRWYDRAVEWMENNAAGHQELLRFRAEAAQLLGVNEKEQRVSSTAPAPAK